MSVYAPTQATVPPHAIHGTQVAVTRDWLSPGRPVTKLNFIKIVPAAGHNTASASRSTSKALITTNVTHHAVVGAHGAGWESSGYMGNRTLLKSAHITPSVTITFGTNRYRVSTVQRAKLHRLTISACWLVIGHTDPRGSVAYNLNLSARRAIAVAEQLQHTRAVAVEAFGSTYAVAQPKFWSTDRRVNVYRISCEGVTK